MGKTILTSAQHDVLSLLSKDKQFIENFYLTGGTALAEYYLHHRLSEDLDFFTEKDVDILWLTSIAQTIKKAIKAEKVDIQQSFNRNLVFFTIKESILKTEFTYFPFEHIEEPELNISKIKIESLRDIAVNKFFTIYQQPSARHFIDLYLILKDKKWEWEEIRKQARVKFDTVIDPIQLGSQLMIADSVSDLPRMLIDIDDRYWRDFFLQKAKELKKEIM